MNLRIKIFLALLVCIQTFLCNAQIKKQRCGSVACDSFRVFREDKKLKLPSLLKSKDSLHFRYYTNCNVVDIWSKDGVSFNGNVITYTYEPYNKKKQILASPKYFSKAELLDSTIARRIYDLSCRIASVPTGDSIKERKIGSADGFSHIFVNATPSCVCQKSYWNPFGREAPEIVQKLNPMIKTMDSILDFEGRRGDLISQLEGGHTYYVDGMTVITVKTLVGGKWSEYFRKKSYNDDYLHAISDSLNNYLSDTLTNIFSKQQPIKCYTDFILHFDSQNTLTKITPGDEFDSKAERLEFRKYRRLIKEAFKDVDLRSVHSELAYKKKLFFLDGKVSVGDFYEPF